MESLTGGFFVADAGRGIAMLDYLWAAMLVVGVVWGLMQGKAEELTRAVLDGGRTAVELSLTMLGIMCVWTGLLEVGKQAGLLTQINRLMRPVVRWLFPHIPEDHPATEAISLSFAADLLGLGNAATPAALKAMKELQQLGGGDKTIASHEICTFLILNIASIQLLPINMIAYRSQYGSVDPAAITGPVLVATLCSTLVGVVFCKLAARGRYSC